ncbi:MAG: hypothetical protein EOO04_35080, partial [Chitinophagaceae bacterium]
MLLPYLKKSFLIIFSCIVLAITGFCQQPTQTLRGTIIDQQSKKGIGQVSVNIAGTSIGTVTDSSGAFVIRMVPL